MMAIRSPKPEEREKKGKKRFAILALLLMLLLFLAGIFLYWWLTHQQKLLPVEPAPALVKPALIPVVSETMPPDTVVPPAVKPRRVASAQDTAPPAAAPDTATAAAPDSLAADTASFVPCAEDTAEPWVYPDPSGGLHFGSVQVRFASSEPCSIFWRFGDAETWNVYSGVAIPVNRTSTLHFYAQDTCGNRMEPRIKKYEIRSAEKRRCPEDMTHIAVGESRFCIDRYEWPNRKGKKPTAYISIYHAMDSCFTAGKRLCTSDEWSLACGGVYSWNYPYGDRYEPHACVTRDTAALVSGKKPECRGYFEVFDMAGNLAEWTDTRSQKNREFFNVMGGFWESGPQGNCFDPRYSYYPQNRHNPVGFRCCSEVNKD
jgi:hypothetical protein